MRRRTAAGTRNYSNKITDEVWHALRARQDRPRRERESVVLTRTGRPLKQPLLPIHNGEVSTRGSIYQKGLFPGWTDWTRRVSMLRPAASILKEKKLSPSSSTNSLRTNGVQSRGEKAENSPHSN